MATFRSMVLLVGLGIATAARSGTDISVMISRDYTEQAATRAIASRLGTLVVPLNWSALVSRTGDATVHVKASGKLSGTTVEVATADADVVVGCGSTSVSGSTVYKCDPTAHVTVDIRNFVVNTIVGSLPGEQANALSEQLRTEADEIGREITCQLNTGFRWANARAVCPTITVSSGADVIAEVDLVGGCITGQTKTLQCIAPYFGSGKSYSCENGRWRFTSGECVRGGVCPYPGKCCEPLDNGLCASGACVGRNQQCR